MNILITGASGFLGTHLCAYLQARAHTLVRPSSQDVDLTRRDALTGLNDRAYDQIYHLAAWTQAGDFSLYHPGEQWMINQQINTNVLSWWQQHQPQAKLIAIGSSCAYDPASELVEDNYLVGRPIESLLTYGMTKRMLYVGQMALHRQFGLAYLHVVPSTLYGPGYSADGRHLHFIFDLMRKILRGKLYGEPVVLWGDGYQKRDLIFIDDFVRIMVHLADTRDNDLVNVGAGEEFTIRHFAQAICDQVEYDFATIRFDTARYVGARSKCLSIDKLHRLISDPQLTPLGAGLNATIAWVRRHWAQA
jgi:GDP-L-fucose synthase